MSLREPLVSRSDHESEPAPSKLAKMSNSFFGKNIASYNLVATSACFKSMQYLRLMFTIINFVALVLYIKIYVRAVWLTYHFWTLLFTFAAFALMFCSAGMEKVRQ